MANIFERAGIWMAAQIAGFLKTPQEEAAGILRNYYAGKHPSQLRVKIGQDDDNVSLNFIGLAVDRSVSMLFGNGLEFDYPEDADAQQEYINSVWDANNRAILFHDTAVDGGMFGTVFVKIVPDGLQEPYSGKIVPRLVLLDPALMTIDTDPMDKSKVNAYIMQFRVTINGKERTFREVTRRAQPDDFVTGEIETQSWIVETQEWVNGWRTIEAVNFPYEFAPIIHWKNMPSIHSVYGMSDVDSVISVQDKYNFVQSNNVKITRYHAHPKTWGAGVSKTDKSSWGADEMILISSPDGKINNLEMQSDLSASRTLAESLRQGLFDVARQVDISSIADKAGQLTNFGIRILYSDAIAKTNTKRELYGEAFTEINRRMLIMAGLQPVRCELRWGEMIPVNIIEEMQADKLALEMGIIDKQTVAEKYLKRYGVDWKTIQERQLEQQGAESNLGAILLRRFNQGQ